MENLTKMKGVLRYLKSGLKLEKKLCFWMWWWQKEVGVDSFSTLKTIVLETWAIFFFRISHVKLIVVWNYYDDKGWWEGLVKKGWWWQFRYAADHCSWYVATLQTIVLAICWEESLGTHSGWTVSIGHPQPVPPRIPFYPSRIPLHTLGYRCTPLRHHLLL